MRGRQAAGPLDHPPKQINRPPKSNTPLILSPSKDHPGARRRIILVPVEGSSWCPSKDHPGARRRIILVPVEGSSWCPSKDHPGARRRIILVPVEGSSWCPSKDHPGARRRIILVPVEGSSWCPSKDHPGARRRIILAPVIDCLCRRRPVAGYQPALERWTHWQSKDPGSAGAASCVPTLSLRA